jgi:hypothetical protein
MLARFNHRPILMVVALAAVVCVLLVVATLILTAVQPSPPSLPSGSLNDLPSHSSIVRTMIL